MDEIFIKQSLNEPESDGLKNEFNEISGVELNPISTRITPRQIQSGVMRGTQRVVNPDGQTITLGEIPEANGDFGIATFNADNELLYKLVGNTWLWNDLSTGLFRVSITATEDDFSFKVAPTGYDVRTATDDQLVFNSANNLFKIAKTGTFTFPSLPARVGTTIGQDTLIVDTLIASTTPRICLVFAAYNTSYRQLPIVEYVLDTNATPVSGGIFYLYNASSYLTGGTVNINVSGQNFDTAVAPAITMRYYVLQETAA